jgi:hypothetical protein
MQEEIGLPVLKTVREKHFLQRLKLPIIEKRKAQHAAPLQSPTGRAQAEGYATKTKRPANVLDKVGAGPRPLHVRQICCCTLLRLSSPWPKKLTRPYRT